MVLMLTKNIFMAFVRVFVVGFKENKFKFMIRVVATTYIKAFSQLISNGFKKSYTNNVDGLKALK